MEFTWSVGHFFMWLFIGRFFLKNWYIFILLSISWEIIEFFIPLDFATETISNKISDLFVNTAGFYLGKKSRK
tara:strand:+ start:983 stop:1201 length:219 start_codon:yes stop_codon:yes gene_type:complete